MPVPAEVDGNRYMRLSWCQLDVSEKKQHNTTLGAAAGGDQSRHTLPNFILSLLAQPDISDDVHRVCSGRNYREPIARLRDGGAPETDVACLAYLLGSAVIRRHWSILTQTSKRGSAKYDCDRADSTSDQPTALAVEFTCSCHDGSVHLQSVPDNEINGGRS